ncbi:MAG: M28 family peptidase [Bacteroidia bacterium]|nr:M28 family peptidase [Bacteroidia bacterium]
MHLKIFVVICLLLSQHIIAFSQDTSYARTSINKLCSDAYHGRGYYKNGAVKAGNYIASEMRKNGAEKIGNSYFQHFSFPVNIVKQVKFKPSEKAEWLRPGIDYVVNAGAQNFSGSILVTQKCFINETLLKDSMAFESSISQNNTTWFVIDTLSAISKNKYKKRLNYIHQKFNTVTYTNTKFTWTVNTEQEDRFHVEIQKNSGKMIQPNQPFFLGIKSQLKTTFQNNIVGMIPGTSGSDSFLVFTAHYDHLGQMGPKAVFRGANDNAAGVAMLLDLIRFYHKNKPKYTIIFIAFAGEEAGLIGSYYYSTKPLHPLTKTRFLLNLDLVGTGETGMTVVNASIFTRDFNVLDSINQLKQYLPSITKRGKASISDHHYFTEKGIPSFFWYQSGPRSSYHDVFDVPETLTLAGYNATFKLAVGFFQYLQMQ